MDVRRIAAAAAIPCLCLLAAEAEAQDRRAAIYRPLAFELPRVVPAAAPEHRLQLVAPAPPAATGMLESWAVGDNAEIGLGRYGIGTVARQRTNLERDRMMERENRNIAGAGVRVRF